VVVHARLRRRRGCRKRATRSRWGSAMHRARMHAHVMGGLRCCTRQAPARQDEESLEDLAGAQAHWRACCALLVRQESCGGRSQACERATRCCLFAWGEQRGRGRPAPPPGGGRARARGTGVGVSGRIRGPAEARVVSPAGLLMRQIREGDFLERNPATGPSLFELAALHQEAGGEEIEVLAGASGGQPGGVDGMESVEDLARQLVLQVRLRRAPWGGGLLLSVPAQVSYCMRPGSCALEARSPSRFWEQGKELRLARLWPRVPVTRQKGQLVNPVHAASRTRPHARTPARPVCTRRQVSAVRVCATGKPRLGDALGAILGQLDAAPEPPEGDAARNPVDLSDSPDDQKLVEAFKAMAPTLDALFAVCGRAHACSLSSEPTTRCTVACLSSSLCLD